jgi:hypothetical protein
VESRENVNQLLELLARKGVITQEEKDRLVARRR